MTHIVRILGGLCLLLLLACSATNASNNRSGPDGDKAGAREIAVGREENGDLNPKAGDSVDWKYFRVPATGMIDVNVTFDNPKAQAVCVVRNNDGVQLAQLVHRGQPILTASLRGEPGIYYLEIAANNAQTSYTIQADFQPLY